MNYKDEDKIHAKNYQDAWVKGEMDNKGKHNCSDRYDAIKKVVEEVKPKRVLDIGCDRGYFCFRIAEDFGVECVGVDRSNRMANTNLLKRNDNPLVIFKHKEIQPEDIEDFDLVLALNVFYHLPKCDEIVDKVKKTASHLIYSIPSKDELRVEPPVYPEDVRERMENLGLGGKTIAEIPTIRELPRSVRWLRL